MPVSLHSLTYDGIHPGPADPTLLILSRKRFQVCLNRGYPRGQLAFSLPAPRARRCWQRRFLISSPSGPAQRSLLWASCAGILVRRRLCLSCYPTSALFEYNGILRLDQRLNFMKRPNLRHSRRNGVSFMRLNDLKENMTHTNSDSNLMNWRKE